MMRYFYVTFLLACVAVISIAGFRGSVSGRPPIELFADMVRQPKLRPQGVNDAFPDRLASRSHPAGTVAAETPAWAGGEALIVNGRTVDPFADLPVNTGRLTGSTNWVETNPLPVTLPLLERGRDRYQIFCSSCHGDAGDGRGMTIRYNMAAMANFHDKRLIDMTDGEIFNTMTSGKNLMGAYGPLVPVTDRWAIIGYIRALQRSQLATPEDAPEEMRKLFKR